MRLYAESSAVLAWLLDEEAGESVRPVLAAAEIVVASELTALETARVLVRATALGYLTDGDAAAAREHLMRVVDHWMVHRLTPPVLDRAGRAFPVEPVRTLDALHLASALAAREAVPGLVVLSLDERVRANATALGLDVTPVV